MCVRRFVLLHACLVYFVLSWKEVYGFEERKLAESPTHTIRLSSLLPTHSCRSSSHDSKIGGALKVVHKYGPCSQLKQDNVKALTHSEILLQDPSRVNSILSKLAGGGDYVKETESSTIPAKHGSVVGTGNYVVTVGLGTPTKELSLVFDTGSDLTWTQCEPCVKQCYNQTEEKFNPSHSSSYSNISCSDSICSSLTSATGNSPGCASSTCVYGIQYGDSSYSVGFFGKETLTLTPTDVFHNFSFGCGQNNNGLFGGAAGLLGLGRHKLSFISQTSAKYNETFSYCLPSTASSTGFLTFGSSLSKPANFTPITNISTGHSFYDIEITGISVEGKKLLIPSFIFSISKAIIDSGTVITRLPPAAYFALRSAFRKAMSKYPMTQPLSILDTCYDFSNHATISIPSVSFFFGGRVEVDMHATGIWYANNASQVCLAFAGNKGSSEVAIFGNVQQRTLEVVYDVNGGRIGFASGGCS